jgi:Sulfotransferase domain
MVTRLAVWSGPRNISTALMRSWENRPDTMVVDEPLYAHYLMATGVSHPGRDEVMAVYETDWRRVVDELLGPMPDGVEVFYQKHMTHHLVDDVEPGWITALTNVMLIRDPHEVLASYIRRRPDVTVDDIGLLRQVQLYDELVAAGRVPLVVDAADFLAAPEAFLRRLCTLAGVAFTDRMLSWPAGPRDTDGLWGKYWYDAVWRSTGFTAPGERAGSLNGAAAAVAAACQPAYERLHSLRWTP